MISIHRRLLLWILGCLTLVLLASGAAVYFVAREGLRGQFDRALEQRARTFASLVIEEPPDPEEEEGDEGGLVFDYKGHLTETELGVFLRIATEDGEVLAVSADWPELAPAAALEPDSDEAVTARDVRFAAGKRLGRLVTLSFRAAAESEDDDDSALAESEHSVQISVVGDRAPIVATESALLVALGVGALIAASGTAAALWVGIGRGLAPIGRLRAEVDGFETDGYSGSALAGAYPEELRPIVGALHRLFERVAAAMDRERRFTDAAAHELRTPIAELRTVSEVAIRQPDGERLLRSAQSSREIAIEMEALLEDLLAVARGGQGKLRGCGTSERVALLEAARGASSSREDDLRARGVGLEIQGDADACWSGPRGAVLAVVRNLVMNACEYTPNGGCLRITATGNGAGAALLVENGPVSLSESDVERMFEPFWRADESRTDRRRRGLGLAIVASFVEGLGLKREAALSPEGLLRIRVSS